MQEGADHLLGTHDFRNFCKVDAAHVTNFVRTILGCHVLPMPGCSLGERSLYVIHIIGTAFLWHQVSCDSIAFHQCQQASTHTVIQSASTAFT